MHKAKPPGPWVSPSQRGPVPPLHSLRPPSEERMGRGAARHFPRPLPPSVRPVSGLRPPGAAPLERVCGPPWFLPRAVAVLPRVPGSQRPPPPPAPRPVAEPHAGSSAGTVPSPRLRSQQACRTPPRRRPGPTPAASKAASCPRPGRSSEGPGLRDQEQSGEAPAAARGSAVSGTSRRVRRRPPCPQEHGLLASAWLPPPCALTGPTRPESPPWLSPASCPLQALGTRGTAAR